MHSVLSSHGRRDASVAAAAAVLALSSAAPAHAELTFPNERAACVAQAWVPFNTDPAEEPGALGAFISGEFASTGEWGRIIRQQGCKP